MSKRDGFALDEEHQTVDQSMSLMYFDVFM